MDLRKGDMLLSFGEENSLQVVFKKCLPLNFDKVQPLPDLRHPLSRIYTLKSENHPDPIFCRGVSRGDAGMYVCFVTSTRGGFNYRPAYLTVIPSKIKCATVKL